MAHGTHSKQSKRQLTAAQVAARVEMYLEAADHLTMHVYDTEEEKEQAKVVASQIRAMAERFESKYDHLLHT